MSGSDSDDELLFAQIGQLVASEMDSVILKYPRLWGLTNVPGRNSALLEKKSNYNDNDVALNYSPDEFRCQFHMSRRCFADIMNKIANNGKVRNLERKLLFSLSMLTSQESYEIVGDRFSLSKSSAHLAFTEILNAILFLFADYVKWPSVSDYPDISQAFREKSGGYLPGIVGAIDACHFDIREPKVESSIYRNDSLSFSIILQAVCDHRKIFTDVYVGSPGSLSASTVFHESNLYKQINKIIPGEYHLIGDSTYPVLRNMMTPFRETGQLSEEKSRYNAVLNSARVTIERALSMLRGRFKKLRYLDTSNPELANKIVCSCITLHNHIRMNDVDEDEEQLMDDLILPSVFIEDNKSVRQEGEKAGNIKRHYLMTLCD